MPLPDDSQPSDQLPVNPADREAQLLVELQVARERASAAARLVLDLNGRLEAARNQQLQSQEIASNLQTAIQTQQAATAEAEAALEALGQNLQRASSELDAQTTQRLAERQIFEQQLAAAQAALLVSQQAQQVLQQQLGQQADIGVALRQEILDGQAREAQQAHMLAELRQALRTAEAGSAQVAQLETALRQEILDGQARDAQQSQRLAELRQALQAAEAGSAQLAETEAGLRRQVEELSARGQEQSQNEQALNQQLRAAATQLQEDSQSESALHEQLEVALREGRETRAELDAAAAARDTASAELQHVRQQRETLEQTLASERNLRRDLQHQWGEYKVANQASQDAAQEQLHQAEAAARASQDTLTAQAQETASLAEQLQLAHQARAAEQEAHLSLQSKYEASLAELDRLRRAQSNPDNKITALEASGQPANGAHAAPTDESAAAQPASTANLKRPERMPDDTNLQMIAADPCPHLGLRSDRDTRHGFPSVNNRCYARNSALEVTAAQQANFCLREAHRQCPVFTGALRSPRTPINISLERVPDESKPRRNTK